MPGRVRQVRKLTVLAFHPYAELFPLIEGTEFAELVADIKANDLRERISVLDGAILDGRNRYRAALAAGLLDEEDGPDRAKYFVRFVPQVDGDPLKFVISKNLRRRHLDESQRAYVAAKLANLPQGRPSVDPDKPANLPVKQSDAAALLNVSERSVRSAAAVQENGTPELQRAVERGKIVVSAAAQAAKLAPDQQRKIASEAEAGRANVVRTVIKQETRAVRERALGEKQAVLPQKRYGVILADPEWRFEPWSRATGMDRAADNHYPTSCTEVIAARDVPSIADKDCVLWLWATNPMLPHALLVMGAWGFDYKSNYCWGKEVSGTGYWNRERHELLLIGTRGHVPCPAPGTQWDSLAVLPRGAHSEKPDDYLEMIEFYFPTLPKIELNRRGPPRPGWDAWGNQAEDEVA